MHDHHGVEAAAPPAVDPASLAVAAGVALEPSSVLPIGQIVTAALGASQSSAPQSSAPQSSATQSSALPQTPATQVAPVMVELAQRTDGSNEMTVSLYPRDLGQVQVHLARASDGSALVTITASEPATLQELSQSAHHLHAALDAASIPTDGRTLTFALATSGAGPQSQPDQGGNRSLTTQARGDDAQGGHQQPWQNQQRRASGVAAGESKTYRAAAPVTYRRRWSVSGLNITA